MVILITGISSGFGLETARLLSSEGHTVYGTVRREVEHLPGVHYLFADVTDNDAVTAAVQQVIDNEGFIDMLVCNAGMGVGGPVEFTPQKSIDLQMNTNFGGVVNFTRAVLPFMRERRRGRIVFISSIGGLMGLPYQGFYSASKFAVEGFAEALRLEVNDFGISVTTVNPGDFSTGFTSRRVKASDPEAEKAYPRYAKALNNIEKDERGGLKPAAVARMILRICKASRPRCRYIVADPVQRLSVSLKHILPDRIFAGILGWYYR